MSLIDRSTLHFIGVFLGMSVLLAGVGGFLALHDEDWRYSYDHSSEVWEDRNTGTAYYDQLPPEKQRTVDRAMDGETFTFETEEPVPPGVVKRNGTYYVFNRYTVFDFLNPPTGGSVLVSLLGFGLTVVSVRADIRH